MVKKEFPFYDHTFPKCLLEVGTGRLWWCCRCLWLASPFGSRAWKRAAPNWMNMKRTKLVNKQVSTFSARVSWEVWEEINVFSIQGLNKVLFFFTIQSHAIMTRGFPLQMFSKSLCAKSDVNYYPHAGEICITSKCDLAAHILPKKLRADVYYLTKKLSKTAQRMFWKLKTLKNYSVKTADFLMKIPNFTHTIFFKKWWLFNKNQQELQNSTT